MILFDCSCGKRYRLDDDKAGKKLRCGACRAIFEAPSAGVAAGDPPLPRLAPIAPAFGGSVRPAAAAPDGGRRSSAPPPKWFFWAAGVGVFLVVSLWIELRGSPAPIMAPRHAPPASPVRPPHTPSPAGAESGAAASRRLHDAIRAANPEYDGGGRFTAAQDRIVQVDLSEAFPAPRFVRRGRGRGPDHATGAVDLEPLRGLRLETLNVNGLPLISLAPLQGMPLRELRANIHDRALWDELPDKPLDLAPLAGMPLEYLELTCRPVVDLAPLAGAPLKVLYIDNVPVRSLEPLRGMPLEELHCGLDSTPGRPAGRSGSFGFGTLGRYGNQRPIGPTDLSPLQGMRIRKFIAHDNPFDSLKGLEGMPLEHVVVNYGRPIRSLESLAGAPLRFLDVSYTGIEALDPLAGAPLQHLSVSGNRVETLDPLAGAPIAHLNIGRNKMQSLEPVRGMPLTTLYMADNGIRDLGPVRDLALKALDISNNPVESLAPLRGMAALESLTVSGNDGLKSFAELRDFPGLKHLYVSNDNFSLRDVEGVALVTLEFDSALISSLAPLRRMASLERLNIGNSPIDDLAPIKNLPLRHFGVSRDIPWFFDEDRTRPLREMKTIDSFAVGSAKDFRGPQYGGAEYFWKKYDEAVKTGKWE